MIAARDPQEFVPGGRQQALLHPGPLEALHVPENTLSENFLLHRFEKVSLIDDKVAESWIIRRSPTHKEDNVNEDCELLQNKLQGFDSEHSLYQSTNVLKTSRRCSDECDLLRGDMKNNSAYNKSPLRRNYDCGTLNCNIDMSYMEEELYIRGNVVVWTEGLVYGEDISNTRRTICSYSSNFPVKQALWCRFFTEGPLLTNTETYTNSNSNDRVECVCIIDAENIRAFTKDSDDFVTALPFKVSKIWNTNFGILLERDYNENNKKKCNLDINPNIFSMAHPLDEMYPVAIKHNSLHLIEDPMFHIIYTNESPSICILHDKGTGQHSVYRIRKIKYEEWLDTCEKSCRSGMSLPSRLKSCNSFMDCPKITPTSYYPSPFNTRPNSATSTKTFHESGSFSPFTSTSRCHTPLASPAANVKIHKNSKIMGSFRLDSNTNIPYSSAANDISDQMNVAEPAICLDYLWSDNMASQESLFCEGASKAFLSKDFTGQSYLCYLIPSRSQLSIVKVDLTNINLPYFGMLTSISAKDAVSIEHLCMLAILEHTGNIVLYSGLTMVGKLHLGGVLAQHVPSPLFFRHYQQFSSPFPKRSSLICTSVTPSADPKFDDVLSPVLPIAQRYWNQKIFNPIQSPLPTGETAKSQLCALRDSIYDRLTLQYTDGTCYRVTLPTLASSPLIERCLNALRQCLQRDATLTLLSRWYSTRNAPGACDLTNEEEWKMFTKLIFELLGYYDEQVSDAMMENAMTPSTSAKRKRTCDSECDSDWDVLLASDVHKSASGHVNALLHLAEDAVASRGLDNSAQECHVVTNAILFPFIRIIHYVLHMLYEDMKLNTFNKKDLPLLAKLLSRLSFELNLKEYEMSYFNEFPTICAISNDNHRSLDLNDSKVPPAPQCFEASPPNILGFLSNLVEGKPVKPFPTMKNVNETTKRIVQICGLYLTTNCKDGKGSDNDSNLMYEISPITLKCSFNGEYKEAFVKLTGSVEEKIVSLMNSLGIKISDLHSLPIGINLLMHNALWLCREEPPIDWNSDTYNLLLRLDLANPTYSDDKNKDTMFNKYEQTQIQDITIKHRDCVVIDGMEGVSSSSLWSLKFPEDLRVVEARKLLQSSKPVAIVLVQRPDVSDHDFIEEQERHLYAICTRTLALPVGRGMFTLRTANPVITEPLPTPPLCLTGKAPPKGTTVEMTRIDVPANMNFWPLFHNGVANGLRVSPDAHNIDTTWITFNRPKNNDSSAEHAGFLMALGLNGLLKNLAALNTFDYLMRKHEMTSLGLLLGLAATYRGTSSISITKMLSIHVEALLPPTSMELDIQQNLQVGALLGIGLVYEGTGHRHMTEILLAEIGRPPGPEMENSVDRESYALAAGLALGLVTLQMGGKQSDIGDLNVPDTLHYYMVGGNKRQLTGAQKEKYKVPSFQIKEGSCVNLDVTAPGATLALGLMYLRSGNHAVADWMSPPHTPYLLDFVRPDFLMLRTLSRALILWDDIKPTKHWIEAQVVPSIKPYCMVQPIPSMDIDYEAMNQAYCNIIAGACFAVGLKYAGSASNEAFRTLLHYCHMFTSLTAKSIAELAGKPTIETCLNFVLLAAAMVMAGTGNLEIMRIVRHLRKRVGVNSSAIVTYGSHLAVHMALGLLFLGGGRYTLSNSPSSVAALVCAFYPKFPTHSNDNRYHLQAFRHLYVLAVEPRLLIPKDIETDQMCYANIRVVHVDGTACEMKAPCLLPALDRIDEVKVHDPRYWPVTFQKGKNFDKLFKLLKTGCISVQSKAGCVSYMEDKYGFRSDLANSLKESQVMPWDPNSKDIIVFTADSTIRHFCEQYLDKVVNCNAMEEKLRQKLTSITYNCVIKDKLFLLPILTDLFKVIEDFDYAPDLLQLQQFKLISHQVLNNGISSMLINTEIMLTLDQMLRSKLDVWEKEHKDLLRSYVKGDILRSLNLRPDTILKLCMYINYYEIPSNLKWIDDAGNSFSLLLNVINKIPNRALSKIRQLFY